MLQTTRLLAATATAATGMLRYSSPPPPLSCCCHHRSHLHTHPPVLLAPLLSLLPLLPWPSTLALLLLLLLLLLPLLPRPSTLALLLLLLLLLLPPLLLRTRVATLLLLPPLLSGATCVGLTAPSTVVMPAPGAGVVMPAPFPAGCMRRVGAEGGGAGGHRGSVTTRVQGCMPLGFRG